MARGWEELLRGSARAHAARLYTDSRELAASVAAYLAAGFEHGEPGLVIARPEHTEALADELASRCWGAAETRARGLLVTADAEATLAAILIDGAPSAARFEEVVGGLLDGLATAFPGRRPRVFGEMVDLLCERGEAPAAVQLEELWNVLARARRFSLLCGYRLDLFDREAQVTPLPDVCRLHSHVVPAHDADRLAHAVDLALDDVLGATEAGKVYVLLGDAIRHERVPVPQLVLMWVSANMPVLANRILASARAHYEAAAA